MYWAEYFWFGDRVWVFAVDAHIIKTCLHKLLPRHNTIVRDKWLSMEKRDGGMVERNKREEENEVSICQ